MSAPYLFRLWFWIWFTAFSATARKFFYCSKVWRNLEWTTSGNRLPLHFSAAWQRKPRGWICHTNARHVRCPQATQSWSYCFLPMCYYQLELLPSCSNSLESKGSWTEIVYRFRTTRWRLADARGPIPLGWSRCIGPTSADPETRWSPSNKAPL